jgi:hypothetical protein
VATKILASAVLHKNLVELFISVPLSFSVSGKRFSNGGKNTQ